MIKVSSSVRLFTFAVAAFVLAGTWGASAPKAEGSPRPIAPFATGGPDSFGYRYVDSQEANGPVFNDVWEDISATGTVIFGASTDDSVSGAISIGWDFPYYGTNYNTCYVTSNGNMHFTGPTATYPGTSIPNAAAPNAMIAGFWADCHTGPDGSIRYSSNSSRFIVQFTSCEYYPSDNGETLTYQIKLLPSGTIFIAYQTMSVNGSTNSTAIGIENAAGSVGLQYCLNGSPNTVASGRVVRFANNTPPFDPTNLVQAGTAGGVSRPVGYVSDSTIYFQAGVSDPDSGNLMGIQAEVLPSSQPFASNPSANVVQTPTANLVGDGGVAEVLFDFDTAGLGSGDYHWRARTFDNGGGYSNWVVFNPATVHFSTDFAPPSVPAGPFTPNNVQLIYPSPSGDVDFSWGAATDVGPPGPIAYRIEISLDNTFSSTIYDSILTGQTVTVNLTASDTAYVWRVSAVDQAGNQGPPSAVSLFQLGWTTSGSGKEDQNANCGAAAAAGTPAVLLIAVAAAILGLIRRRSS